MKQALHLLLQEIILGLYTLEVSDISLDFPNDIQFGDLTTNIAMVISKKVGKAPSIIAAEIVEAVLNNRKTELQGKIATAKAVGGFINISFSQQLLWENILAINSRFGNNVPVESKRLLIEYGQPNTHKLPHIGHLFSYIVGDSLTKIEVANGHSIMQANYQGDIGPHVAKSLYGYIQLGRVDPKEPLARVQLLQKCYQEGSSAYDADPIAKETIDDINKKIYTNDPEIVAIWRETRQWSIDYYAYFEQLLGVQQTMHYWESDIWKLGKERVEEHIGEVFEKSEGAVIFPGKKFGLHDRVFLTKMNTPTYEAKDVGLNIQKYEDWKYDLNIITTASEQNAYFDVVIKAIEQCAPYLKDKMKHIGFGMVSLSTGKMSSRTGQIVSAVDLIDEVKQRVHEIVDKREGITPEEKKIIVEKIAIGAIKFAFLKQNILQDMKFDIEESVSFDGRSGPYIQYTFARIQSIMSQTSDLPTATTIDFKVLETVQEHQLLQWLYRFPQIVEQAGRQFAPHIVAEYTYQAAQLFNAFYATSPIMKAPSLELQRARHTLAEKTAVVIKNGLALLGIEVVEKM